MFRFLFSPVGRVSRADYWLRFLLPYFGASVLASIIDAAAGLGAPGTGAASLLLGAFYIWPNVAVSVKRYHDRSMSGWWVLWSALILMVVMALYLVAIHTVLDNPIGAWITMAVSGYVLVFSVLTFGLILYVLPGVRGANAYGADPLGARPLRASWRDPAKEFPGPWTRGPGVGQR
jgi:uncharacterized membrane protein YhaH (DUF805 family)